ncbi:MAG: energy-coupling factor transporter transmembrane component T family protein [Angustibacter sp.]
MSWPPSARCSPSALLTAAALAVVGSTQVRDVRDGLVMVGLELLLAPLAVDRPTRALRRLVPGLLAAASLGASSWWLAGNDPDTALAAGLRILALVLPASLVAVWVDPSRLGDELAQWLRLPPRPVVASVAALQQLEELSTTWATLDRVRHVRGLGPSRSPWSRTKHVGSLTFALLVHTLRRSGQLALAMDARGFATAHRRTWARAPHWGGRDTVLVVLMALVAATPWVLG